MGPLPHVFEDFMGVLQVLSDDTVLRSKAIDFNIQSSMTTLSSSKTFSSTKPIISISESTNPSPHLLPTSFPSSFTSTTPDFASALVHGLIVTTAAFDPNAIVFSPDYRLAPKHRLQAAIDNTDTTLKWLQAQALLSQDDTDGDAWVNSREVDREHVGLRWSVGGRERERDENERREQGRRR